MNADKLSTDELRRRLIAAGAVIVGPTDDGGLLVRHTLTSPRLDGITADGRARLTPSGRQHTIVYAS